jgi:hypothetical protein
MPRALKTFAAIEPVNRANAAPTTNSFTLDLGGLSLSSDQLSQVRQQAVKAAMTAAAGLLGRGGQGSMDYFGTFSTFATFSTFGSVAARPELQPGNLASGAQTVINRALGTG